MYDQELFFIPNLLNRHAVGSRSAFKRNADGSVDLYLQKDPPGAGKEANWLPSPAGNFVLMLRAYWPKEAMVDGTWKPPPVKRIE